MPMLRRLRALTAAGVLIAMAACSTPAQRISTALVGYGLERRQADCVGERLGDRLSMAQLRRLQELGRGMGGGMGRQRIDLRDIALRLTDPDDPELVAQVLRAGLACTL